MSNDRNNSLRDELMRSASELAIADAELRNEARKKAAQEPENVVAQSTSLASAAPAPAHRLAPKTSWSMHMMTDVLYAHFLNHYVEFTPEDPADQFFTCQIEEQHDTGRCAFQILLRQPADTRKEFGLNPGLKISKAQIEEFAQYLDDLRFQTAIDDMSIETRYNQDRQFMVSIETGRKRAIFDLMKELQKVHPQFYAGPLDIYETLEFGTSPRETEQRWARIHELAKEFRDEFNLNAAAEYGDEGPVWMNAMAGLPIYSEQMMDVAVYMGNGSISPYSMADIEATLCHEEKKPMPYHLQHHPAALGIN